MSESTRAAAKAMGEVMVAFGDGADIEFRWRGQSGEDDWRPIEEPNFDWVNFVFRVVKKEP